MATFIHRCRGACNSLVPAKLALAVQRTVTSVLIHLPPPASFLAYRVKLESSEGDKAKARLPGADKLRVAYRNLEPGTTYQISVRARNEWGKSIWPSR